MLTKSINIVGLGPYNKPTKKLICNCLLFSLLLKNDFKTNRFRTFQQEKWNSPESFLSWLYQPQQCAIPRFIPPRTAQVPHLEENMSPQWPVAATISKQTTSSAINYWRAIHQRTALYQIRVEIGLFTVVWLVDLTSPLYRGCRQDLVILWTQPMAWNSSRVNHVPGFRKHGQPPAETADRSALWVMTPGFQSHCCYYLHMADRWKD